MKIEVQKEDVRLNAEQYDDVKYIIELLKSHNKGEFAEIIEFIIPEQSLTNEDENNEIGKKKMADQVVIDQDTPKDLLELLGFDDVENESKKSPNVNPFLDPFDHRSELSKVFNTTQSRKKFQSKTKKKSKNNGYNNSKILREFDPFYKKSNKS